MRLLLDLLHPAHVHFFRPLREEMLDRGHDVIVTARDKDITLELLESLSIPAVSISTARPGRARLAQELAARTSRLVGLIRRHRPDVLAGIMGPAIALAGKLTHTPAVVFYDTEFATASNRFTYPLATAVCTPDCYAAPVRGRHITYPGYHELAYLHPRRFTPDKSVVTAMDLEDGGYSIVRFVGWEASHDAGEVALSADQKRVIVDILERHGPVLISSEATLPPDLVGRRLPGPPDRIHHLIAGAAIVVGESATMSSEAAVLGTPSVFIAKTGRGYTDEQEKRYGLVRHLPPHVPTQTFEEAIEDHLSRPPSAWNEARSKLLVDKIDVTDWMLDLFERRRWVPQE